MREPFCWRSELSRFSPWCCAMANITASTKHQSRPVIAVCAATRWRAIRLRPATLNRHRILGVCKATISIASLHLIPRATSRALSRHARRARVHALALLTRRGSRPILMTWKVTTAPAFSLWAVFVRGAVRLPACIHVERHWMCVSFVAAWWTRVAICLLAGRLRRLLPHMVCSKAGAGAIRTMVTSRLGRLREIAVIGPTSCGDKWHLRLIPKLRSFPSNDRPAVCGPAFRAKRMRIPPSTTLHPFFDRLARMRLITCCNQIGRTAERRSFCMCGWSLLAYRDILSRCLDCRLSGGKRSCLVTA
jgi:hypothetical protein